MADADVLDNSLCPGPFDAVAETYDETFTDSGIGRAQRAAITEEMDRLFRVGERILEINCGTGVDATHLAHRGIEVLACDSSPRMIEMARRRAQQAGLTSSLDFRVIPTERIRQLSENKDFAGFDGALSNFAGLNCVESLSAVAEDLGQLLKPGAKALFCVFGRFCAWEIVWYLAHGNPRKALRRFQRGTLHARLAGGVNVLVRYPSVHTMARKFAPEFALRRWKGIGVAVPPSYLEGLAQRSPRILKALVKADRCLSRVPLLRGMADHVLLEFERV